MATTKVSPDADAIVAEIQIAAPRERVFQALTDPKKIVQWWGRPGSYQCTTCEIDLRAGGKWLNAGMNADGKPFEVRGEYLQIEPPRFFGVELDRQLDRCGSDDSPLGSGGIRRVDAGESDA
jgi:uncharacterized protein YndB with AHSA1/START domain